MSHAFNDTGADIALVTDKTAAIDIMRFEPTCSILFTDIGGRQVGYLDWTDGTLRFTGSADDAAQAFFMVFGGIVDSCVEKRLKEVAHAK